NSATATLTVNAAVVSPSITTQPANQTVNAGQAVSFTVSAGGTPPFTYQWQKSVNGTWTNTSGATGATYAISAAASPDAGGYRVVVSNSAGSATSNAATLVVNTPTNKPHGGTPWAIPGKIEAENYDDGGEGVAYHDLDATNNGGQYRT